MCIKYTSVTNFMCEYECQCFFTAVMTLMDHLPSLNHDYYKSSTLPTQNFTAHRASFTQVSCLMDVFFFVHII